MDQAKTDETTAQLPHPEPTSVPKPHEEVTLITPLAPFHPLAFFRRPFFQVVIISMVCFCCPGIFNALSGLGGGGQINPATADNANVALYSTFATTAFMSGTIVNKLGPRLSLSIGW